MNKVIANPVELKKNEELYNEAIEIFHPFDGTFIEFLNVHNYEQIEMKNYAKCLDIAEIKLVHLHQHLQEYDMSIGDQAIEAAKCCTHLGKKICRRLWNSFQNSPRIPNRIQVKNSRWP